jgi:lysozyme family protein
VANPVDTYVRPAEPAPSSLHDVAKGLAAFDDGLSNFLAKRQAKQDDMDRIRGEAEFNKNNTVGWSEAVKQGIVPADASPAFVDGYKQSQGKLAGVQLRDQWRQAYDQWELKDSADPEQFQEFYQDFLRTNLGSDDPEVLRGLNPYVEDLSVNAYETFSKERTDRIYRDAVTTRAALSGASVDDVVEESLRTGEVINYDLLWDNLMQQREEALATGIRAEDFDRQLVETLSTKAMEHYDPGILELLDKTLPGDSVAWSDRPEIREKKLGAGARLEDAARRRQGELQKLQKDLDDKRHDEIKLSVARQIAQDPSAEVPEEVMREWEKYDPLARVKLGDIRKKLAEGSQLEDPKALLDFYQRLSNGGTVDDINEAVRRGIITTPATYNSAMDRLEKYQKSRRNGDGITGTQTARRFGTIIKDRTTAGDLASLDPFGARGLTDEGLEAQQDFELMLLEWEEANPNATAMEKEKAINEIGEIILKRIDRSGSGEPQYVSPTDAEEVRKGLQDQANTEQENITKIQEEVQGEPPEFGSIVKEQQDLIIEQARKYGITPEEMTVRIWGQVQKIINDGKDYKDVPLDTGTDVAAPQTTEPPQAPEVPAVQEPVKTSEVPTQSPRKGGQVGKRYYSSLDVLLPHEGGYVDHSRDPGGATNMGITFETLRTWRGKDITKQDVKNLGLDEVRAIYKKKYWDVVRADELPSGLDHVVFDSGVNSGNTRAVKWLQLELRERGLYDGTIDGRAGPLTMAGVAQVEDVNGLINSYLDRRMRFLKGLRTWDAFGKGWTRRVKEVRQYALANSNTNKA